MIWKESLSFFIVLSNDGREMLFQGSRFLEIQISIISRNFFCKVDYSWFTLDTLENIEFQSLSLSSHMISQREVQHWCFPPLVLSASGGMGPTAKAIYKKLAPMVATKPNQWYSQTSAGSSVYRLSFSLLHTSLMCLRGSYNRSLGEKGIIQKVNR